VKRLAECGIADSLHATAATAAAAAAAAAGAGSLKADAAT